MTEEKKDKKGFSIEELHEIALLIDEAYTKAGKKIQTAELMMENEIDNKLVIDNRTEKDIN